MAQIMLRNYLQETEDAISSERIDEALANCQNILKYFPESLEAQRLLGEVQLAQGHLEEAQHTFDWVLTNDPENVIAYCDRALICERKSDFDTALDCYQQAYELSRGNKQIREEFSKLSAKVGQQGFMFSRAGLARLYMRGDLLMQAIQEWEAVLASTPDRLDARTGLLEAYWRENLYNQAEELAKDVLRDVPGCLKALLLLAYIASMGNMQQAQEYMQRAEALDPDLVMAQELFADVMASQPAHPFLKLLKKSPATLQVSTGTAPNGSTPIAENGFALANGTLHPMNVPDLPASTDGVPTWSGFEQWNSESTFVARQDAPFQQDATASPLWNNGSNPALDIPSKQDMPDFVAQLGNATANADVWNAFAQETAQPVQYEEPQFDAWQSLQVPQDDAASNLDLTKLEPAPWESLNRFSEPGIEGVDIWGSKEGASKAESAESAWPPLSQEESAPSPPAWLSMLTQGELQQLSGTMPAVQPVEKISPISQPAASQLAEPVLGTQPAWGEEPKNTSWADESKVAFSAPKSSWNEESKIPLGDEEPKAAPSAYTEDEEPLSFGPEWLKSLGAASIGDEVAAEPAAAVLPPVKPEPQPQAVYEQSPVVYEPQPQQRAVYESQTEHPSHRSSEEVEQNVLTTLEELEQRLFSKGFVPLEPNSLSAIAQSQEGVSSPKIDPVVPQVVAQAQETYQTYQEPSLSSALAELGNFAQQSPSQANQPVIPATPQAPVQPPAAQPQWLTSLKPTPAPAYAESKEPPIWDGAPTGQIFNPVQMGKVAQELPARTNVSPEPVFEPVYQPAASAPQASLQVPSVQTNPLLDSELETTMKRPAVRLQSLSQRPASAQGQTGPLKRSRMGERPVTGKAVDNNLNPQERLVRGYQYQLAGDYDGAMQEYRVIVKSAPELLGEVVSNVRALLKLAPKYSVGYRVLGDAYMRQGEYLQAMEAYNKALTMAKKARN